MAEFFIAIVGVQQGPFPSHELLARGMRADSLVWCEGMGDWQRADTVPELAAVLPGRQQSMPPQMTPQQMYGTYPPPMAAYAGVPPYNPASSNRVAAGVCGILLGGLGIHKFILGMTGAGLTMLLVTLLSCGAAWPITHVIGIIEGIIYLSKSDPDFHQIYVVEKRSWF